jgi:hypothetical protein
VPCDTPWPVMARNKAHATKKPRKARGFFEQVTRK